VTRQSIHSTDKETPAEREARLLSAARKEHLQGRMLVNGDVVVTSATRRPYMHYVPCSDGRATSCTCRAARTGCKHAAVANALWKRRLEQEAKIEARSDIDDMLRRSLKRGRAA